ncbi:MAG: S41 family peptidase [Blastochloris sp.]|nr:S41 family peptidase [Blastochloris sp.]
MRPAATMFGGFRVGLLPVFVLAGLMALESARSQNAATDSDQRYKSSLLLSNVTELIREEYVEADQVGYSELTYAALEGMLNSLDPYCEFLDPQRYLEMKNETEGEFGGLGIYVGMQDSRNLVINMPIEGTPAFRAGMMPGDWIVKINDTPTKGLSLNEAIRLLRGKVGDAIKLLIYRPSVKETHEFVLVREMVTIPTVRGSRILNPGESGPDKIGYIRISQFGERTLDDFDRAMKQLQGEGMNALVLDLRNNPGGLLDMAVQVAGRFTVEGTPIVSTEGRFGASGRAVFTARGRDHYPRLPMVILVNRHSASGAEIVAGALKDLGRAVLIGETTYGKGSVQTVQPLEVSLDKPVAVRLTTAHYYTPSRKPIHKVGVPPDIEAPVSIEEEQAILRRQNWHMLTPQERQELEKINDLQLDRAVAVLKGIRYYTERRGSPSPP